MAVEDADAAALEAREPTVADLVELCRELNRRGTQYLVVGGFAMRIAGLARQTGDIDLLIDARHENVVRALEALCTLPDGAARELTPEDLVQYAVVRICDEIVVDLMRSASGIDYAEALREIDVHELDGVSVPVASPELLLRMKGTSYRPKDAMDAQFLRRLLAERSGTPE